MWSGDSVIEVALERDAHPAARLMEAVTRDRVGQLEDVVRLTRRAANDVSQCDDDALLDRQRLHRRLHDRAGPLPPPDLVRESPPVARVRPPVSGKGVGAAAEP